MLRIFFILYGYFSMGTVFAISSSDIGFKGTGKVPPASILPDTDTLSLISLFTLAQSILLKVVLPIVVIGASLYIAYELFTAEGDEAKMKKAWKSVAYSAIALIAIALSYALVSIVSRLSF